MTRQSLLPFIILVALISLLFWELKFGNPNTRETSLAGAPVPQFRLPNLYNPQQMITEKELQKGVVLLNIWASWCYACGIEHETLLKINHTSNTPIYSINYKDNLQDAKEWLKTRGNPYRLTAVDKNGDAAIEFGVYGTPETFVIHQGKIIYRHIGAITEKDWRDVLQPLINKLSRES